MFGISPLGWLHTLGSLPAIPIVIYMFARHGRIVPRSRLGGLYLASMLIGATTVFLVAHQPISYGIGAATILVLLAGFGAEGVLGARSATRYIETLSLSVSAFLLMLPTVTEILRRVPDGHPVAPDLNSPVLLGAQAGVLLLFLGIMAAQLFHLTRRRTSVVN